MDLIKKSFLIFFILLLALSHSFLKAEEEEVLIQAVADQIQVLTKDLKTMSEKSMEIAVQVLERILNHLNENKIIVPIGLNVEHIMSYNFQASIEMLQELSRIYREFCIKTDIYN